MRRISIIDLIGDNEAVAGQHHKKPQHIINYSEDAELGKGFTEEDEAVDEDLDKKAHGLFGVPIGRPDGNDSNRPREKYEQQDKEVAERFFGGESNIESEESRPPINIDRSCNKTINNPVETELEDFFSFLHSEDGKLKRKRNQKIGTKMSIEQIELKKLAKALHNQGYKNHSRAVSNLYKKASIMDAAKLSATFTGALAAFNKHNYDAYKDNDDSTFNSESKKILKAYTFWLNRDKQGGEKTYSDKSNSEKLWTLRMSVAEMGKVKGEQAPPAPHGNYDDFRPIVAQFEGQLKEWEKGAPIFWTILRIYAKEAYNTWIEAHKAAETEVQSAQTLTENTTKWRFAWDKQWAIDAKRHKGSGARIEHHRWDVQVFKNTEVGNKHLKALIGDDGKSGLLNDADFIAKGPNHDDWSTYFRLVGIKKANLSQGLVKEAIGPRPTEDADPEKEEKPDKIEPKPLAKGATKANSDGSWTATNKAGKTKRFTGSSAQTDAVAFAKTGGRTAPRINMSSISNGQITDDASGNAFRKWVHDNNDDLNYLGTGIKKLDLTGDWNNKWMKAAWEAHGDQYVASLTNVTESDPQGATPTSDAILREYLLSTDDKITSLENRKTFVESVPGTPFEVITNDDGVKSIKNPAMAARVLKSSVWKPVLVEAFDKDKIADTGLLPRLDWASESRKQSETEAADLARQTEEDAKKAKENEISVKDFYLTPEKGLGRVKANPQNTGYASGTIFTLKKDHRIGKGGEHFFMNDNGSLQPLRERTPAFLSDEEQKAVLMSVPYNQRELWENFLDQQMQAEEAMGERQTGFKSMFRQDRLTEQTNYDEARAEMGDMFRNESGGQSGNAPAMPGTVNAPGANSPGTVNQQGAGSQGDPNRRRTRRRTRRQNRR